MWLDYDEEADVLYLQLEDQPRSTHSQMRDDGVLDYGSRKRASGRSLWAILSSQWLNLKSKFLSLFIHSGRNPIYFQPHFANYKIATGLA